MRIGVVAPPWLPVPPPGYGGTEAVVDALARGYAARGHDVVLATTGDSTCPVPRVWCYDQALGFPTGATPFEVRHVAAAYDALAGCDVVDDHTVLGPLVAATGDHPPIVWTNHGPFDEELLATFERGANHTTVVAISRTQAATSGCVPISAVIHHGLDIREYPAGTGDGGYLVHLGRMAPSKGAPRAIDLARAAGIPLIIAGKMTEPAERQHFETEIRPRLGHGVEFIGEVGPVDKVELLGGAIGLLNPIAWDEPFGLVMIEALATGTPVVTTPRGAAPEIVDDGVTGFLGRTDDELVAGLHRLGELDRAACRATVVHRFSIDRMVDAYLGLLSRVGGRSRLTVVSG